MFDGCRRCFGGPLFESLGNCNHERLAPQPQIRMCVYRCRYDTLDSCIVQACVVSPKQSRLLRPPLAPGSVGTRDCDAISWTTSHAGGRGLRAAHRLATSRAVPSIARANRPAPVFADLRPCGLRFSATAPVRPRTNASRRLVAVLLLRAETHAAIRTSPNRVLRRVPAHHPPHASWRWRTGYKRWNSMAIVPTLDL